MNVCVYYKSKTDLDEQSELTLLYICTDIMYVCMHEYILQHDGNLLLDPKKTLLLYVCRRWHKNIPQKNQ